MTARAKARGITEVLALGVARARESIASSDALIMCVRAAGGEVPPIGDLTFRRAEPSDGERYARDIGTESPDTFRSRLSDATRCYLVIREQRFVHSSWITTESAWTREIRRYLSPPPGDAYVYESFTRPEMRGKGVYPFALLAISATLGREEIERIWVAVEAHNVASKKSMTKAGFDDAFTLPYKRFLGRLTLGPPEGRDDEAIAFFLGDAY